MSNSEVFDFYQPQGGSDPAHTALGASGISAATPAMTPLMLDAATGALVVWDGAKAGTAIGVLALALAGTETQLTYFKTGTFRREDLKWPQGVDAVRLLNAFAGTAVSVS